MKRVIIAIAFFVTFFSSGVARAQENFWVQIEAHPTLLESQDAARALSQQLADVNGFRLGASGWYAIALGPFSEAAATQRLLALRGQRAIPADAYVTNGAAFAQQFWPVGGGALTESTGAEPAPVTESQSEPELQPIPDETRQEALQSERLLDRDQKKELQVALQWEGFYKSAIDGDFGPGTRGSMTAWQESRGYGATGVLTTGQRAELLGDYNAMLASLGLATVIDTDAGIEIELPTAMVSFTRYEAPFAHYEGDQDVRVVLISQRGDKATLYGLYDILQTLEVVPPEGARTRRNDEFTIEGANSEILSYTHAVLTDGAVKGYMLIWPRSADERGRTMVLDAMRSSFASTGAAVLDDSAGLDTATQSIDLLSGLQIRRAEKARSGFFVSDAGAVLTTTEAVDSCERITIDESYDATVTATDAALGLALLTPTEPLAPLGVARFPNLEPRLKSEIIVSGYSYGGRLNAPTLTFGVLADIKGLRGEDTVARLDIHAQDGDTGGPVLDGTGAVIGMLQASPSGDRLLPADVGFAAKATALAAFLEAGGLTVTSSEGGAALTPFEMSTLATDITVLVSCWK